MYHRRSLITVRATWERPSFGDGYRSRRAWRIYLEGQRLPGWYVVDGESPTPFRTVIHDGVMTTSWHLGMKPGDMARRYMGK